MKGIALILSRTRNWQVLATLLAVLLCSACAAAIRDEAIDLGQYGPVIDTLYQHIGNRELLLCVDGDRIRNRWKVRDVAIPLQTADSAHVYGDGCKEPYNGDIHNHPSLGGDYHFREIDWFSEADLTNLIDSKNLRFSVLWFAPGKFTGKAKR